MAKDGQRPKENAVSESAILLKQLRLKAGYSIREIAEIAGFGSGSAYQHYETRYKELAMPVEIVERLRPVFLKRQISNEEIDRLILRASNVEKISNKIVNAPVVSWVQAGEMADVPTSEILAEIEEKIPVASDKSTVFFLRVRGNSMNRVAPDGALVLVDYTDKELFPKKCYVIKSGGAASFKRYQAKPPCFVPDSTEPGHTIIPISEEIEIIGRVVKVQNDI